MLLDVPYNRDRAVEYARTWALARNPLFVDFTGSGGNCTNFVSQCIFAGCGVMNDTPTFGWYYRSGSDRAPAWTGVNELFRFLTGASNFRAENGGSGPYAEDVATANRMERGDIIQLANAAGNFYHTLFISEITENDILVCAHSNDALDRPLSTYSYASLRVLHLLGAKLLFEDEQIYLNLLNGISLPTSDPLMPA